MFLNLDEVKKLIEEEKLLHIAADESLLSQLPKGNWIGGSTPYFITNEGGIRTKEKLFVNEIKGISQFKVELYDENIIEKIEQDTYDNGFTILIVPFASKPAISYANKSPYSSQLLINPIVGWVSGYDLSEYKTAKVYNGITGECYEDKGIALHVELPEGKLASLNIVNIFDSDENSDTIEFESDSLSVIDCMINGKKTNFMDYLDAFRIDTQLPLVANNNGININVSIKSIDKLTKTVHLYAPVFKDCKYSFAKKIDDYESAFIEKIQNFSDVTPAFSCNCILNFIYGNLTDKKTPPFEGPITFGEIAYQLLNQTLVYLEY